jgi:ATP-dependent Lon protease
MAAEYPVAMNYVEFMLDLPWAEYTVDDFDLKRAKKILDHDHFGLTKVKTRILEYLAVLKLKNDMKGPILCLYGPPGWARPPWDVRLPKRFNASTSVCHWVAYMMKQK